MSVQGVLIHIFVNFAAHKLVEFEFTVESLNEEKERLEFDAASKQSELESKLSAMEKKLKELEKNYQDSLDDLKASGMILCFKKCFLGPIFKFSIFLRNTSR